jgi:hypothetical protein
MIIMSNIIQPPIPFALNTGVIPNISTMCTADSLSDITAAGYLNASNIGTSPLSAGDLIFVKYDASESNPVATGTNGIFTVELTNGELQLATLIPTGNAVECSTLPTTYGQIPSFSNTSGDIEQGNSVIGNSFGSIFAGDQTGGAGGGFFSFSGTVNTGFLRLAAVPNSGNYNIFIENAAFGQSATLTIPDPGASAASFLLNKGSATLANGNSLYYAPIITVVSGGTCTLNGQSGAITTEPLTTAQYATYTFVCNNSFAAVGRLCLATVNVAGGNDLTYGISVSANCGSGTITFALTNLNTAALNGTVSVNFWLVG